MLCHCVRCSKRPSENWGRGCGEKWLKEPGGHDDSDGLAEDGYIGEGGLAQASQCLNGALTALRRSRQKEAQVSMYPPLPLVQTARWVGMPGGPPFP